MGVWVDRGEWDALIRQRNNPTNSTSEPKISYKPHSTMIPPLIDIYFRRIHPVLPILSESEFRQSHAEGMANETLVHAICNAAAKDAEAASHLRLTDSPGPLAPREFCSRLHTTVKAALKIPAQFEKLTLIRILALASLHAEGQDGGEEATLYLVQALHYGQTLALHLAQQAGLPSGEERSSKVHLQSLVMVNDLANPATAPFLVSVESRSFIQLYLRQTSNDVRRRSVHRALFSR